MITLGIIELLLTATALAMDAFAVSISIGACRIYDSWMPSARMGLACGGMQALMPIAGWMISMRALPYIKSFDHWLAFGLLLIIGIKMIFESREEKECPENDPTKGMTLFFLALATSIDAMAAGISTGAIGQSVLLLSISTGIITTILSGSGIYIGKKLGTFFGKYMELSGGLMLCIIGIRILFSHLK